MKKIKSYVWTVTFCLFALFVIKEVKAEMEADDDYVICPGWGHKCISVTKDTWIGKITVPVYLKGKDKPTIEFKDSE